MALRSGKSGMGIDDRATRRQHAGIRRAFVTLINPDSAPVRNLKQPRVVGGPLTKGGRSLSEAGPGEKVSQPEGRLMDVELGFHELASGLRFQSCPIGDDSFERLPKALHVIGLRQYPHRLVSEDFGEARK